MQQHHEHHLSPAAGLQRGGPPGQHDPGGCQPAPHTPGGVHAGQGTGVTGRAGAVRPPGPPTVLVDRRRIFPGACAQVVVQPAGGRQRHGPLQAPGTRHPDDRHREHGQVFRAPVAGTVPRGTPWRGGAPARGGQPRGAGHHDAGRRGGPLGDGATAPRAGHPRRDLCRPPAGAGGATGPSPAGPGPCTGIRAGGLPFPRARTRLGHPQCDGAILRRTPLRAPHHHGDVEQRNHQAGRDGRPGPEFPVAAHHGPGDPQRPLAHSRRAGHTRDADVERGAPAVACPLAGRGGVSVLHPGARRGPPDAHDATLLGSQPWTSAGDTGSSPPVPKR
jgi:hypothetical protein